MNRVPFSQIINTTAIDLKREYQRLFVLFYRNKSSTANGIDYTLWEYCAEFFADLPYRGTCITLKDFDDFHKFDFPQYPPSFDINYLILFCEYSYNLVLFNCELAERTRNLFAEHIIKEMRLYIQQIMKVIESIGYMENRRDGISDFVPKDQAAISVAEIINPDLSYKVIEYNHHSMKGDLERKKSIILCLADKLEPQRAKLKSINASLEDQVFFLFNNVNLRHNNADPEGKKYIPFVAGLKEDEIEQWYDDTYQMCLLAFLELDNEERKSRTKQLKQDVQIR